MPDLDRLKRNLDDVRARIAAACVRAGRNPDAVTLIVVTKAVPAELIPHLAGFGVTDIGENRPVEGGRRTGALKQFRRHLIGALQTNKVGKALEWAAVVHSLDRPALLEELGRRSPNLPVFVQVNISGEASKGGYKPREVAEAVAAARRRLRVEGLMTMAPVEGDARPHFRALRELAGSLGLAGLSMGMSQDYERAVEEGATHVRVGSAIFEGVAV